MKSFFTNKITKITTAIFALVFLLSVSGIANAQANPEINYQGKLTNSSGVAVPDGLYNINFWLVPSSGGATSTAVWSEARTGGNTVQVTNGLFSVMLGSVSALSGVDFDQTLYLAVEIGGTGTAAWDGELLPRKILGTVPAAFVANYATTAGAASSSDNALTVGGVASSSFLRSDEADNMTASSAGTLLTLVQNGVGKVLSLFSGVTEVFTVLNNGNVGVGTSTPASKLSVVGDSVFNGNISISGTVQAPLLTPGRVIYSTAGSYMTDTANFVFDGTNLGVGTSSPSSRLSVQGDSTFIGNSTTTGSSYYGGNVGIGTDVASFALSLGGSQMILPDNGHLYFSNTNVFIGENSNSNKLELRGGGSSGGSTVFIDSNGAIGVGDSAPNYKIEVAGTSTSGYFAISSTAAANADVFAVNGVGNVGIGTSTPGAKLDVFANATSALETIFHGSVSDVPGDAYGFAVVNLVNNDGRISPGFVGKGNNSAYTGLNFYGQGSADNTNEIPIVNFDASIGSSNALSDVAARTSVAQRPLFNFANSGTSVMAIIANGNVGIGTTTPSSKLTVAGDIFATGALRDSLNSAGTNGQVLQTTGTGSRWVATSTLGFGTGNGSVTSVALSAPTGFSVGGSPVTTSGTLALSYAAGYEGVLTASSTNWNAFYNTPSSRITAGTGLAWSANTLNCATASGSVQGCLTAADWTTFNNKVSTTSIDTSAKLAAILSDESGTGVVAYTTNPIFTTPNLGTPSTLVGTNITGTASGLTAGNVTTNANLTGMITSVGNAASLGSFTSSNLFTALSDKTGTGVVVFGTSPVFTTQISTPIVTSASTLLVDSNTTSALNIGTGANAKIITIGNSTGATSLVLNAGTGPISIGTNAFARTITMGNTTGASSLVLNSGTGAINIGTSIAKTITIGNNTGATGLVFNSGTNGTSFSNGSVSIGTTTMSSKLTVAGDLRLTGAFKDSTNATGTLGMVLQTTGTSTRWVATSTLGISGGASNFLGLTDTISSFNANRILYTSGSAVIDNANFTYNGTDLGLGGNNGIAFGGSRVFSASTTLNSIAIGQGSLGSNTGYDNIALGDYALEYNSSGINNVAIGGSALNSNTSGGSNTAVGSQSLRQNTIGGANSAFGGSSLYENTTGDDNSAFGFGALGVNTTGSANTAMGWYSLHDNVAGEGNTVLGHSAGRDLNTATSTGNNTFIGRDTGRGIVTGLNNTILGANVTGLSSTLSNNIIIADGAGNQRINVGSTGNVGIGTTTPGSKLTVAGDIRLTGGINFGAESIISYDNQNVVFGSYALGNAIGNPDVYSNVAIGAEAGNTLVNGWQNVFIGNSAGIRVATGSRSVIIGNEAVGGDYGTTDAGSMVIIGDRAGYSLTTGGNNSTYLGFSAGENVTEGGDNTLIGYRAGQNLTTGWGNIFLGTDLQAQSVSQTQTLNIGNLLFGTGLDGTGTTLSSGNIGIGTTTPSSRLTVAGDIYATGELKLAAGQGISINGVRVFSASTTAENFAIGSGALVSNTTGDGNVAFGQNSLYNNTSGGSNVALGRSAMYNNTSGGANVSIGENSMVSNSSGFNNVAIGSHSLYSNETGFSNSALGFAALYSNVTGESNSAIGWGALGDNLDGSNNVAFGTNAGVFLNDGVTVATSSDNSVFLGYRTKSLTANDENTIVIGYEANGIGSNTVVLGNDDIVTTALKGNVGIGTTTPGSLLSLAKTGFTGAGVAGISQYFTSTNSTLDAVQYGNSSYLYATNTATTTIIGNITRIADSTTFGNTVRGIEVQVDNGNNTKGENTAISGFARTFGVRGTTVGDAGGVYEPAGVFGETEGTTQGNAIRGYSSSITTAALLKLFQDTSAFTGTGLLMNFGNAGGSFSSTTASKFIDLQNAGSSRFSVGSYGMLTIGNGATSNNAGIQIGYGGICVDNDGSCTASTTGRISAVSYHTGNSDLAENYFSNENLKSGEVVYLKGGLSVGRATEATKEKVIGVITTKPGLLLGFDDTSLNAGETGYGVALAGRVPVRLSNENGEIKVGDELMLSSLPGIVMKATSTGKVVGIALEDFNESRAYSDTYINQFGDDLVDPIVTPINPNNDPRLNDGCYYGGGNASGDEPCVPLTATTTDAQVAEAEALAQAQAQADALAALAYVPSQKVTLSNGEKVKVGQIVMFVELKEVYLDVQGKEMIAALLASAESAEVIDGVTETVWHRLVSLANNFIDGVLSVFTLKADRVEVKNEICVDGVCLNSNDIRQMLDSSNSGGTESTPEPEPEEEVVEEVLEEEVTEEEVVEEETPTEEVVEEEIAPEEEVVPEETPVEEVEEPPVEEVVEETPEPEPEVEVVEEVPPTTP